jgi:hypothetical protein
MLFSFWAVGQFSFAQIYVDGVKLDITNTMDNVPSKWILANPIQKKISLQINMARSLTSVA